MVKAIVALVMLCSMAATHSSEKTLRESADVTMGPRSLLLSGGDVDSPSGRYMISFPAPNDCVQLGTIEAATRSLALYRAVSKGGFTLKPSDAGLTVWTIEEWEKVKTESWYPQFKEASAKRCGPTKSK